MLFLFFEKMMRLKVNYAISKIDIINELSNYFIGAEDTIKEQLYLICPENIEEGMMII